MFILKSNFSRRSIAHKVAENLETEKSADAADYRTVLLFLRGLVVSVYRYNLCRVASAGKNGKRAGIQQVANIRDPRRDKR